MGVKNIAINCRSRRAGSPPYTTPGLGDRIHTILLMYRYSQVHNTPVRFHLSRNQWGVGDRVIKNDSWRELLTLVPEGSLSFEHHDVGDLPEQEWVDYLRGKGYEDVETYYYFNKVPVASFEITQYIKTLPELDVEDFSEYIDLPKKFITEQWDSQEAARSLTPDKVERVRRIYKDMGYDIITINKGHLQVEQKKPFDTGSLKAIAYCMKKAAYHVGANSGFFHLAHLYKTYDKIRIYTDKPHNHVTWAANNGSKVNFLI